MTAHGGPDTEHRTSREGSALAPRKLVRVGSYSKMGTTDVSQTLWEQVVMEGRGAW